MGSIRSIRESLSVIRVNVARVRMTIIPESREDMLLEEVENILSSIMSNIESDTLPGFAPEQDSEGTGEAQECRIESIQPRRILLMDDEQMVLDMTSAILGHLGYEVVCEPDGDSALERYKTAPFDAVILDLSVNDGMGGIETVKRLLSMDPEARAVLSTGYTSDPAVTEYARYGFSGVITKPYNITDLEEALKRVFTDRGTGKTVE